MVMQRRKKINRLDPLQLSDPTGRGIRIDPPTRPTSPRGIRLQPPRETGGSAPTGPRAPFAGGTGAGVFEGPRGPMSHYSVVSGHPELPGPITPDGPGGGQIEPPRPPPPQIPFPVPGGDGGGGRAGPPPIPEGPAMPGPGMNPVTGSERPFTVMPPSGGSTPLLGDMRRTARENLENPGVFDDDVFQRSLEQGRQAVNEDLAGRGILDSTFGTELFSERVMLPLQRERLNRLSQARQQAFNQAMGADRLGESVASGRRGERRGERAFLEGLRGKARQQAIQEAMLAEQFRSGRQSEFQNLLQQAFGVSQPPIGALTGAGSQFGSVAGSFGGVAQNNQQQIQQIAMLAAFLSSADFKTDIRELEDPSEALEDVRGLNLYRWRYLGDDAERVGPILEDESTPERWKRGRAIDVQEMLTTAVAAIQELDRQVLGALERIDQRLAAIEGRL